MKKVILSVISLSMLLVACSHDKEKQKETIIYHEVNMEDGPLNVSSTMTQYNAHTGNNYSSTDSVKEFAAGNSFILPDSLKTKDVTVYISAWVRELQMPIEGGIAVSLNTSKGNVAWNVYQNKNKENQSNTWVQIKDSVKFTSTLLNDPNAEIRVIGYKHLGSDKLDIDDIQIKYKFSK